MGFWQVKLMFEAPDPTIKEIWVFRQSVQERVALLESAPRGFQPAFDTCWRPESASNAIASLRFGMF